MTASRSIAAASATPPPKRVFRRPSIRSCAPTGDRPQGPVRQPQLHDRDQGAEPARKRRSAGDAVPALRDAGIPMPLPLAARLGGVLGQSLRAAPRNVGLLPATPPRLSGHGQGRPAVLKDLSRIAGAAGKTSKGI